MKTKSIIKSAIIAAMYIVLTLISSAFGLASGAIQIRISEALTILAFFTPYAIYGLFAGCLLSNIITGCILPDTILGSIATLIGALLTYFTSKLNFKCKKWLAPIGPVLANSIIIPIVLTKFYGIKDAVWFLVITVGIGEIISCGVLGMLLMFSIDKHKNVLFR